MQVLCIPKMAETTGSNLKHMIKSGFLYEAFQNHGFGFEFGSGYSLTQ